MQWCQYRELSCVVAQFAFNKSWTEELVSTAVCGETYFKHALSVRVPRITRKLFATYACKSSNGREDVWIEAYMFITLISQYSASEIGIFITVLASLALL